MTTTTVGMTRRNPTTNDVGSDLLFQATTTDSFEFSDLLVVANRFLARCPYWPALYWAIILSGNGENNLEFRFRTNTGGTTRRTSAGSGLQINEWTHVAVTWDASDPYMRLYKNGREIDNVSKAGTAVATSLGVKIGIGNQSVSAGPVLGDMIRPFDGLIDEVRVYDRAVSETEMAWLAGMTKPFDEPF